VEIKITRWDNQKVIVCGEYESVKDCLEKNKEKSFYHANLSSADLSFSYLRSANLRSADLSSANLSFADLRSANLSSANLSFADLRSADLSFADLRSAKYLCPSMFLLINWGSVSEDLCLDLMRYDAENHPIPEKFLEWAKGGLCPYSSVNIVRVANFTENRELVKDDFLSRPVKSAYELMQALIKEKCK